MDYLEQVEDDVEEEATIEKKPKVKKTMSETQKLNLQKGRDVRKATSEQKKKETEDNMVKVIERKLNLPVTPAEPPKPPPKKKAKQTIVICEESESSEEEAPQIIIKRKKKSKKPVKQPIYEDESSDDEPPPVQHQQNYIKLIRKY